MQPKASERDEDLDHHREPPHPCCPAAAAALRCWPASCLLESNPTVRVYTVWQACKAGTLADAISKLELPYPTPEMPRGRHPLPLALALALLAPAALAAADKEVLVVYFSHSGHTALLAEAIAAGARSVPATSVRLLTTGEATGPDLMAADAFIIGCPTYFGDQASNLSAWVETEWMPYWQHGNFSGKKGAAFTTGAISCPPPLFCQAMTGETMQKIAGGGLAQGMEFTLAGLIRRLVHFKMDVVYPDQTFGSGYHSYGALAVTGTAPWNHRSAS